MPFRRITRLAAYSVIRNGNSVRLDKTRRPFHSSAFLRQDDPGGPNHYETLNVGENASAADIKKSFYSLSKTHHPDHNPSDPDAPGRFMRISDAYAVLSSPEKRTAYDRDVMRRHHRHAAAAAHPRGSYSSTGPAGGRAASGLSRRRSSGPFPGPPPSFYRNGGWGAHGAKRAAAQQGAQHRAESGPQHHQQQNQPGPDWADGPGLGGMGYGQGRRGEHVPHFDHVGHERTHRRMDRKYTPGEAESIDGGEGFMAGFLIVSSVLAVALMLPALLISRKTERAERAEALQRSRS